MGMGSESSRQMEGPQGVPSTAARVCAWVPGVYEGLPECVQAKPWKGSPRLPTSTGPNSHICPYIFI